ncbi:neuromedin Bb [Larimichthys crocea]|uniref:neuromedin Bb n=1 Tax=Larimichthys crocea TaxID=215358 RepID=UPI0009017027|nr:neuromedin-B [Larimichthys crocea]
MTNRRHLEICALEDSSPLRVEMKGFSLNNVCQCGLFTYLVFFSFISFTAAVSFDLTELRNKVAKIKVNPRGNLWATGHFMGKKSVMDTFLLPPAEGQGTDALEVTVPAEQSSLGELLPEFLRVALQAQVDTQESRSKNQEADLLMKILESYIRSRK